MVTDPEPLFAQGLATVLGPLMTPAPVLVNWGSSIRWPGPSGAAIVGVRRRVAADLEVVARAVASHTPTIVVGGSDDVLSTGVQRVLSRDCQPADLALAVQSLPKRPRARRAPSADASEPTARELDVVELLAQGMTNREIAGALFISEHTVRNHVGHLFTKLGVNSRTQAVMKAGRLGWLQLPG